MKESLVLAIFTVGLAASGAASAAAAVPPHDLTGYQKEKAMLYVSLPADSLRPLP